jgi:hypothetical protein
MERETDNTRLGGDAIREANSLRASQRTDFLAA